MYVFEFWHHFTHFGCFNLFVLSLSSKGELELKNFYIKNVWLICIQLRALWQWCHFDSHIILLQHTYTHTHPVYATINKAWFTATCFEQDDETRKKTNLFVNKTRRKVKRKAISCVISCNEYFNIDTLTKKI